MVGIKHRIAVLTSKLFAPPVSYVEAVRAGFTRVGGWHRNQFNTTKQRLIFKKLPKLIKRPFANTCSKLLALFIGRKANAFQILNSNSFAFGMSWFPAPIL
jgi:hypothetical protein